MNDISNESNDCNETNDTGDDDGDENGCWKVGWRWLCWMRRLRFKSIENKFIVMITEWSNGDERDSVVVIVGEGLLHNDDEMVLMVMMMMDEGEDDNVVLVGEEVSDDDIDVSVDDWQNDFCVDF